MQKILYITIALLFYTSSTKAQNKPFSVRINPDEKSEDGHQIEILDNKIYICASNNYKVDNVKKIGSTLYLTDMNGKEIKNIFYPALSSI